MAENILATQIQLRYDTYGNWKSSKIILRQGEAAICVFPYQHSITSANIYPDNTPPAIGIKIGDGQRVFNDLPWVQAIAADVYSWAKESEKPAYSYEEIDGLQNYIESLIKSDISITISPRVYSFVEGTGENSDKYYLQYKENNEEGDWIVDTSSYIDLAKLTKVVNWITESDLNYFSSLGERTDINIEDYLGDLQYNDSESLPKVVTSVSQQDGLIKVTKKSLGFQNISGTLPVTQGGTGRTELTENSVLVGNGTNAIKFIPIAEEINNSDNLVTSNLLKQYVDEKTAGITGAMHFIGETTVKIVNNSDTNPQISNYNFSQATPGDVILYDTQEYVWTGTYWHLLGDEGSYAIKGSIVNADIADDAEISQEKIHNLIDTLEAKVNVIEGKGLSSNDYTDEDKAKLASIQENAQENVIEHIFLNENEAEPKIISGLPKSIEISEFDRASRTKLENIAPGAEVNKIEAISLNGKNVPPDEDRRVSLEVNEISDAEREKLQSVETNAQYNKIESISLNGDPIAPNEQRQVNLVVSEFTTDAQTKLNSIEIGAQVNMIEHIKVDGKTIIPDATKTVDITTTHTEYENKIESIKLNETELVPDQNKQVQINADQNVIEQISLNGKVIDPDKDKKVALEVNEILPEERQKLGTIEEGAQENVIESILLNEHPVEIQNKNAILEIRGLTSDEVTKLTNIEDYAQSNIIESIIYDGVELTPGTRKEVRIVPNHHPEHENKIEKIYINGIEQDIDENKSLNISITQSTLNLNVLEGAQIPDGTKKEEVEQIGKKLQLERIAVSGDVKDLKQTEDTYIIFDCGSSTTVI